MSDTRAGCDEGCICGVEERVFRQVDEGVLEWKIVDGRFMAVPRAQTVVEGTATA